MTFLAAHPYRELTIPILMAETSVERTSFYTSFTSIPDVVKAILYNVRVELSTAGWTAYFAGNNDPEQDVHSAINAAVQTWKKHGPMLRAISEAAPLDPELEQLWIGQVLGSASAASANRIKKDQALGLAVDGNALELATAVNRLIVSYLNDQLGRPGKPAVAVNTIASTLETMVIGAIYGRRP